MALAPSGGRTSDILAPRGTTGILKQGLSQLLGNQFLGCSSACKEVTVRGLSSIILKLQRPANFKLSFSTFTINTLILEVFHLSYTGGHSICSPHKDVRCPVPTERGSAAMQTYCTVKIWTIHLQIKSLRDCSQPNPA